MARTKSLARIIAEPLLVAVLLAFAARAAFRIYSIPSASMSPTLLAGDHIVVTPYRWAEPARGDVVVFRSPATRDELVVKRVIAVAGDLIDSSSGRVRVGGHTLAEPYLGSPVESGAIPAQLVPEASYFVMGDNRANSVDSRNWGAVPRVLVIGRARMVLWSSPGPAAINTPAQAEPALRSGMRPAPFRLSRVFKCVD